jgi:hypothetical protein
MLWVELGGGPHVVRLERAQGGERREPPCRLRWRPSSDVWEALCARTGGPIVAVLNERWCQRVLDGTRAGQGGGGALPGSFMRHTSHHALMPQGATG